MPCSMATAPSFTNRPRVSISSRPCQMAHSASAPGDAPLCLMACVVIKGLGSEVQGSGFRFQGLCVHKS